MPLPVTYQRFIDSCAECEASIIEVCNPTYDRSTSKLLVRSFIASYSFLKFFTCWESFISDCFTAYSLGEASLNGNYPLRYILPQDEDHVDRMIRGLQKYPDFTNADTIVCYAENYFQDGIPFAQPIKNIKASFSEAKTIRNAISHSSTQSKEAFDNLVRTKYGAAFVGMSVSDFLLDRKPSNQHPFYKEYFLLFSATATSIVTF